MPSWNGRKFCDQDVTQFGRRDAEECDGRFDRFRLAVNTECFRTGKKSTNYAASCGLRRGLSAVDSGPERRIFLDPRWNTSFTGIASRYRGWNWKAHRRMGLRDRAAGDELGWKFGTRGTADFQFLHSKSFGCGKRRLYPWRA